MIQVHNEVTSLHTVLTYRVEIFHRTEAGMCYNPVLYPARVNIHIPQKSPHISDHILHLSLYSYILQYMTGNVYTQREAQIIKSG